MKEQTARILIVEDNPGDARLLQEYLKHTPGLEYSFLHCTSVAEAIDKGRNWRPALVVLDLNLSDSSGLNTLLAVREAVPDLPVIVWTGYNDPHFRKTVNAHGALACLCKNSVDARELQENVRNALGRGLQPDARP